MPMREATAYRLASAQVERIERDNDNYEVCFSFRDATGVNGESYRDSVWFGCGCARCMRNRARSRERLALGSPELP